MRILYIADLNLRNGGAQRRSYLTLPSLAKRFDLVVASLDKPDESFKNILDPERIQVVKNESPSELLSGLVQLSKKVKPDLLVLQWEIPWMMNILRQLGKTTKCPYAIIVHELPLLGTPPRLRGRSPFANLMFEAITAFFKRDLKAIVVEYEYDAKAKSSRFSIAGVIWRFAKYVHEKAWLILWILPEIERAFSEGSLIVISEATMSYLRILYPNARKTILLKPGNGASAIAEDTQNIPSYDIAYMARLSPQKGTLDLLKILGETKNRLNENLKAIVIGAFGSQHDEREFRKRLDQMDLVKNVTLAGFVPDSEKYKLLRRAKIFAYPSVRDGFSLSALDALSSGLPIVTWDLPFSRYVLNCRSNIRVRFGDFDQFTKEVIRLLIDEKLRYELSVEAINFSRRFSWDKVVESEAAAYKDIFTRYTTQ